MDQQATPPLLEVGLVFYFCFLDIDLPNYSCKVNDHGDLRPLAMYCGDQH